MRANRTAHGQGTTQHNLPWAQQFVVPSTFRTAR